MLVHILLQAETVKHDDGHTQCGTHAINRSPETVRLVRGAAEPPLRTLVPVLRVLGAAVTGPGRGRCAEGSLRYGLSAANATASRRRAEGPWRRLCCRTLGSPGDDPPPRREQAAREPLARRRAAAPSRAQHIRVIHVTHCLQRSIYSTNE